MRHHGGRERTIRQATFFSIPSQLVNLGPNGTIAFSNSKPYVLAPPYTGAPTVAAGYVVFRGNTPYAILGRSVFTVGP